MSTYEVAVLYHPSLEVGLNKAEEQVFKIFSNSNGKVTKTDNWGKRKLVYPIKKQDYAIYVFYIVEMPSEEVQKVETALNIADEVIRYMIVKPDFKAAEEAEKEKAKKAERTSAQGEEEAEPGEEE